MYVASQSRRVQPSNAITDTPTHSRPPTVHGVPAGPATRHFGPSLYNYRKGHWIDAVVLLSI